MPLTKRQIRNRIRKYIATEMRGRLFEIPGVAEDEPPEVLDAWEGVVIDLAEKIWPEDRADR